MTQTTNRHLGESLGTDFFSVREQFTDEQWSHFITVRRFTDEEVAYVVEDSGAKFTFEDGATLRWPVAAARYALMLMVWLAG